MLATILFWVGIAPDPSRVGAVVGSKGVALAAVEVLKIVQAVATLSVLMGHRQVTDLHLVNLARRHAAQLATFDRTLSTWLAPADRAMVVQIPVGA